MDSPVSLSSTRALNSCRDPDRNNVLRRAKINNQEGRIGHQVNYDFHFSICAKPLKILTIIAIFAAWNYRIFRFFMQSRFRNQVAIITGSTEGIGLATAVQMHKEGAKLVINGRNAKKLEKAIATITQQGDTDRVHVIQGSVTEKRVQEKLINETLMHFGKIDVLVNNVGGGTAECWIENITDEDWDITLEKNLSSAFALCRDVVKPMRDNGYGKIVNVSSVAGRHKGRLSGPQYTAAKAGMLGLTRHLAWDLAQHNITVNAVAPGFVMTDRVLKKWETRTEEEKHDMLAHVPMKRFANPDEIANVILFLASLESSYITGVSLDANGGSFMS